MTYRISGTDGISRTESWTIRTKGLIVPSAYDRVVDLSDAEGKIALHECREQASCRGHAFRTGSNKYAEQMQIHTWCCIHSSLIRQYSGCGAGTRCPILSDRSL